MTDNLTQKQRSHCMSKIRSKGTRPELIVRSIVHKLGFRFRLHRRDLPGIPDLVLPRHRVAIFVHGCFWHQHPGCIRSKRPKSNTAYWEKKLDGNIERDLAHLVRLQRLGWRVGIVWECETAFQKSLNAKILRLFESRTEGLNMYHHGSTGIG
jgi:DNA mismatch endonuclease (patch repair protein)